MASCNTIRTMPTTSAAQAREYMQRLRRRHSSSMENCHGRPRLHDPAMHEELNRKLTAVATRIQAVWTGFSVRKVYTSVLRRRMEIWHEDRKRERYQAATVLQAGWRGYSARKSMKQWMTEIRRERKAMEEERHKAACVLQAYWRMHSCRIKFLQQIKSNTLPHNLQGETCITTTILQKQNMGSRLTVAQRLEWALELKSQGIITINTSRHVMQSLMEQSVAMKSMESSDSVARGGELS